MRIELPINQLEQELVELRTLNRKLLKEIHDVRKENYQLKQKFQQDRLWLAQKLAIISESQIQGDRRFSGPCSCGLPAVLEQAQKRSTLVLTSMTKSPLPDGRFLESSLEPPVFDSTQMSHCAERPS